MPYEVVKKPCTMSSGKRGQAVIYKLTDSGKEYVSCQTSEQVAYSVIAQIEASEKAEKHILRITEIVK